MARITGLTLAVALAVLLTVAPAESEARLPAPFAGADLARVNRDLAGRVVDHTANHGTDRRITSNALGERRDVYVYLPPGYDGVTQFPLMVFLHGLNQDERIFLEVVGDFDAAIRAGTCPPMVIVVPDGSLGGRPKLVTSGSFFINSRAGRYGDYIVQDLWPWVFENYAIRPERGAHCLAGASMGGFGAYNIAFQNKHLAQHVIGMMPPLNLRYGDCNGRYLSKYDANCFQLRTIDSPNEVVGRFYGALLVRAGRILTPLVGEDFELATAFVSLNNPYELLTRARVQPGEFELFIGYGKRDEFNIDAEVESFLDEASRLGVLPTAYQIPNGRHSIRTARELLPLMNQWLLTRFRPFLPPGTVRPAVAVPLAKSRSLSLPRLAELRRW